MLWSTHRIRLYEELHGDNNQKSLFRNTDSTITFGTSSAPFLARLHEETADDNQELLPRATQVLFNDFFVGLLSGASAVEEAMHLRWDVSALLQTAGFTQRKWASNHPTFLDAIPEELQETHLLLLDNRKGVVTVGLLWNPDTDQLQVQSSIIHTCTSDFAAVTKCKVLSIVASIFNLLGPQSPVICSKLFLQLLCQDKLEWHERLSIHLQKTWNQQLQSTPKISKIKKNKKFTCSNVINVQLHSFL